MICRFSNLVGNFLLTRGGTTALTTIHVRVQRILCDIPAHVTVVAAAKGVPATHLMQALEAGIHVVGQNHISEARRMRPEIAAPAEWHFIGRLQPHAVRTSTLSLFDAIQSVDSLKLAERIDAVSARLGRCMPVFVEVNSGREPQKGGILPESVESLVRDIARLPNVEVMGLMTMAPLSATPHGYRPWFAETRQLFEHIRGLSISRVRMEHLSMGMSDSYEIAIDEGATMVRLGTILFGVR